MDITLLDDLRHILDSNRHHCYSLKNILLSTNIVVPEKMFTMYDLTNENEINIDLSRVVKEEDAWWSIKPLTHLDLSSNVLTILPKEISMFQDLMVLNVSIAYNTLYCRVEFSYKKF